MIDDNLYKQNVVVKFLLLLCFLSLNVFSFYQMARAVRFARLLTDDMGGRGWRLPHLGGGAGAAPGGELG